MQLTAHVARPTPDGYFSTHWGRATPRRSPKETPVKWLFLSIAIAAEVVATSAMKASEGFTRLWPSVITLSGYVVAFYFLSQTLKSVPVGVAYAIWSGVGIVAVSAVAWLVYDQKLDAPAIVGMALIVTGVVVMNAFSKAAAH